MQRQCEVCASFEAWVAVRSGDDEAPAPPPRRVLVEDRVVALCDEHAEAMARAGCQSLDELRELFPEPYGDRSLVPRRAPLDRRVFPPRPEGRRHDDGRRRVDETG